jgi:hypothetical protein
MSREELIARLQWNGGGCGFGLCGVANAMSWAMATPGKGKSDLKSIVAVSGPPEKYTDEELKELVAFSDRRTTDYDRMFPYRMGANLICIDKTEDGQWMRKRLTWEMGPMFSDTLTEAIAVFELGVA